MPSVHTLARPAHERERGRDLRRERVGAAHHAAAFKFGRLPGGVLWVGVGRVCIEPTVLQPHVLHRRQLTAVDRQVLADLQSLVGRPGTFECGLGVEARRTPTLNSHLIKSHAGGHHVETRDRACRLTVQPACRRTSCDCDQSIETTVLARRR